MEAEGVRLDLDLTGLGPNDRLVALAGPNGAGKTTVLDNLHPYRLMPSHVTEANPKAFSFWDHLSGTTGKKVLEWQHGGATFRSVLEFRSSGKSRKQTASLLKFADGNWEPYRGAAGLASDGSTDNYDRCVVDVIGPPEVFFVTQFAAQARPLLSSYTAGEMKGLLVHMLGFASITALRQDCTAVLDGLEAQRKLWRDQASALDDIPRELATLRERKAEQESQRAQTGAELEERESTLRQLQGQLAHARVADAGREAARQRLSELTADRHREASSITACEDQRKAQVESEIYVRSACGRAIQSDEAFLARAPAWRAQAAAREQHVRIRDEAVADRTALLEAVRPANADLQGRSDL